MAYIGPSATIRDQPTIRTTNTHIRKADTTFAYGAAMEAFLGRSWSA